MKTCAICGKSFEAVSPRQQCCSDECRAKRNCMWQKKSREKIKALAAVDDPRLQPRPCVICGAVFAPLTVTKAVCSDSCSRKREKIRREMAPQVAATCVVCGKRFKRPAMSERTTCSQACRRSLVNSTRRSEQTRSVSHAGKLSVDTVFSSMSTGCQEFPSWDHPQIDPFSTSMDHGGVWVSIGTQEMQQEVAA